MPRSTTINIGFKEREALKKAQVAYIVRTKEHINLVNFTNIVIVAGIGIAYIYLALYL